MVKICPECGKENTDTNKFCEYCGLDLPISEENNNVSSIIDNPKEVIKQNVDTLKDKVDSVVTEEKLAINKKKIKRQEKELEKKNELITKHDISEKKIERQKEEIAKNKEIIARQNKNISNNKTVNDSEFHKLKYKLFYWNNKELNEYAFSKTKSISILIFVFFFVWYILTPTTQGIIPILVVGIMIGLIFAVPAFVIGFIIHYLMNR